MTTVVQEQARWIYHLMGAGPASLTYPQQLSEDDVTDLLEWLALVTKTLADRRERRRALQTANDALQGER